MRYEMQPQQGLTYSLQKPTGIAEKLLRSQLSRPRSKTTATTSASRTIAVYLASASAHPLLDDTRISNLWGATGKIYTNFCGCVHRACGHKKSISFWSTRGVCNHWTSTSALTTMGFRPFWLGFQKLCYRAVLQIEEIVAEPEGTMWQWLSGLQTPSLGSAQNYAWYMHWPHRLIERKDGMDQSPE